MLELKYAAILNMSSLIQFTLPNVGEYSDGVQETLHR